MSDTPHRPLTRSTRRATNNAATKLPAPPVPPATRAKQRAMSGLRSYASFPALVEGGQVQNTKKTPTAQKDKKRSSTSLVTPTRFSRLLGRSGRQPEDAQQRREREELQERSLLACLTPTGSRPMTPICPQSISPSPSPTPMPYQAGRATHRRLTFSQADLAPRPPVAQPAVLFTPPATKLVKPDPSAFTSTGLMSKKQLPRTRTSFVVPETPCKRPGAISVKKGPGTIGGMKGPVVDPEDLFTPENSLMHSQNTSNLTMDMEMFRLGKHRNSSAGSLRRLRKKPHLAPGGGEESSPALIETPSRRTRHNTLVEDDFTQEPPPGFRIPSLEHSTSGGSSSLRPLPPTFAPQHQQMMQSLTAGNLVDPDRVPWDQRRKRCSWASTSDASSVSSAATLAPHAQAWPVAPRAAESDSDDEFVFDDISSMSTKHQDNAAGSRVGRGGKSIDCLDDMDMDDADGIFFSPSNVHTKPALTASSSSSSSMQSPKILALERPQMPQIVNGFATNYPQFLPREYFEQKDKSLPFLAPTSEFHVDGIGYLNYFAHQFEVIAKAGEGNFSSVLSVRSLVDGQMYAVKKTRQPYGGRQARARQLREVELLWRIPNSAKGIVKLFNAWEQSGHLFMQFELCERGNLADYLDAEAETDRRPSEARAWAILAHAANALGQVHAIDIVHLDVKPANFLLGDSFETTPGAEQHEGWLKLADFGHATQLPYESQEWVEEGDREYMAPEVLQGRYSKPADVFSLGMMMLEIVANIVLPDNGVEWQKLREGCFDDANFIDLPYSSDLLDTIKWMLTPDPDMRPTAGQIAALDQCRLYTGHHHAGALVRSSTAVSVHPMTTRSAAHAQQARPLTRKHSAKPQQAPQSRLQSQRKTTRSNPTLARRTASAAPAFPT